MKLLELVHNVKIIAVSGKNIETDINTIQFDSRAITKNDVFVAVKGGSVDGHDFIAKAIELGAIAVVCEQLPKYLIDKVTYIKVTNSQKALAIMAANYYHNPSKELNLIGITGTNGKTTVSSLLYQLFKEIGYSVGLLSTVKIMVADKEFPSTYTTPDSIAINSYLRTMVNVGVTHCFMEVSSHGIHQERTTALNFSTGVFTNLTHDHLDYHQTFGAYRDVKKRFFDELPLKAHAIVNLDDKNGAVMLQNTKAKKVTYALKSYATFNAQILEKRFDGLLLKINEHEVWSNLIGKFNAYNLLAVFAVANQYGLDELLTLQAISKLKSVVGRFQYYISENKITAIVDYAHTPDALKNVLETINEIRTGNEALITVVGCGGDRDRSKRPIMANIATMLSTKVILTSDNPRYEDPVKIIEEMEEGISSDYTSRVIAIEDRRQAIKTACSLAKTHDIILIAGKGHETYQEINGVKKDFDDMKIVNDFLKDMSN